MSAGPPPAIAAPAAPIGTRTFRRAAGTRAASSACVLLFVAGTASVGATSGITPGLILLAGLSLLCVANAAGAWADRYTLGETGIVHRNALLAIIGARPRHVPWEDVVQVHEHHRLSFGRLEPRASALFLVLRNGRRLVLDSLADFEEVLSTVRRHCGPLQ